MNRRHVLGLFLSAASSALLGRRAGAAPSDQGIGGTGMKPPTDESDRGIGGTGVIGTIKKFGSIVVNDLRIAYPKDATVRIDGRPASVSDLKIGQVVRVAASGQEGALSTRTIDVSHEVVGPVEKVGDNRLTVLGQKVSTADLKETGFKSGDVKVGDVVAVSGLRRNDGTIAASLIQPSPEAQSRLAGPLKKGEDGTLTIGGRQVVAVDPRLAGQRVVLEGAQSRSNRFVAVSTASEKALLPPTVRKLSIETYVERSGDTLRSGSGYAIGGGHFDVPSGRSIRAVLQTNVGTDGRLTVDSVRAGGRTYGGGGPGGRGPGSGGPGGKGPGGKGSGGRGPGGKGPGGKGPNGKGPGGKGERGKSPGKGPDGHRGGRGDRGPAGGKSGGRGPEGRGFGGREPGGRDFGRGAAGDRRGGRVPMDFGRGSGGGFDGGRGGGYGGGAGGGYGGGGFGGAGGGYGGGGFGGGGGGYGGGGFGGGGGGGYGGGGGGGGFGGGGGGGFGGGGGGGFGGGGGGGRR